MHRSTASSGELGASVWAGYEVQPEEPPEEQPEDHRLCLYFPVTGDESDSCVSCDSRYIITSAPRTIFN